MNHYFKIKQIDLPERKSLICNTVLRALPGWFGVEASIVDYVEQVRFAPFWVAFDRSNPIGCVSLKIHNPFTSEIRVMGVLDTFHRQGIGRRLLASCEDFCVDNRAEFLTVKTLDESVSSNEYAKTRAFYFAMGFRPLEVFPLHWDRDNPCLFMAKRLYPTIEKNRTLAPD